MNSVIVRSAKLALFTSILSLIPSILTAQPVPADYVLLWSKSDDWKVLEKPLREAADRGYRLVPGQDTWPVMVLEKPTGDAEPVEYLILTGKADAIANPVDEASAQGYRLCSLLRGGLESPIILAMQREEGKTARTHEYTFVATRRPQTLQDELSVAGQKGFRLAGQVDTLGEYVAVMERPLQSAPAARDYLVPWIRG